MRLELTDDEQAVQEVFAGFFAQESPPEVVRAAEPGGHDGVLWEKLSATGAPGMAVPEAAGGGGATLADLAIVATEAGRRLAPVPVVEHTVATRALVDLATDDAVVADLVAGSRIATVALNPAIDGVARLVPAGAVADVVLAVDGSDLVVVESDPVPGPANTGHLPLADRDLSVGSRRTVGAAEAMDAIRAEWQALTAATLVGLGFQALTIGVEYVMERTQFDVPVGSFQAVQHGLADASVAMEGADYLTHKAIWALDTAHADAANLAAMAFLFAAEAAQKAAANSLQYHGGYGYSEEYDIQLYYRQAKGRALVAGDPGVEIQTLADRLLGPRTGAVA